MTSKLIVNSVRHTGASADGITMAADGSVTFPGNATCSGTASGFGKILQVQSSIKKDTASFELSSGYFSNSTQTGIQVSITPSNASNKILLFGMVNVDIAGEQFNIGVVFDKAGSILSDATGDASGSRKRVTALGSGADHSQYAPTINLTYLDTAGGTSAITYGLAINNPSSISRIVYINRSVTDSNDVYGRRAASTITAMEIEA
tara:strand:+ start:49 stop:663 length:615 start_codon:yes stop_codon:yes gene_type:complete